MTREQYLIGTDTDGSATITIPSASGRRSWLYRVTAEGPMLVSSPPKMVRGKPCLEGQTVPPSPLVEQQARWAWVNLMRLHVQMHGAPDAEAVLRASLDANMRMLSRTLLYATPGVVQEAQHFAHFLHRTSVDHMTPPPLRPVCLAAAGKVSALVRRMAVNGVGRVDPGTPETLEKLRPDPVETLFLSGVLSHGQKAAADEIRRVYRAITGRLDAKAASLEPAISGGGASGEQPIESLSDDLSEAFMIRYRPWRARVAETPWHFEPKVIPQVDQDIVKGEPPRSQSWPIPGVTYWQTARTALIEGEGIAGTTALLGLPPGRVTLILMRSLAWYGEKERAA